ncbi:MAG: hypothetical protein LBE15_03605, partial [Burkholderiales bacterium]|nr:hypothetical protein [Burkholderiales bacterium]
MYTAMQNAYNGISNAQEKALVLPRDIDAKNDSNGTETVPNQYFWPLSTAEASALNSDAARVFDIGRTYWLRSPGSSAVVIIAAQVIQDGSFNTTTGNIIAFNIEVRPAFNLDISSVLFTSAASGAGVKPTAAGSTLSAATATTGAVKFTMRDSSLTLGSVTTTGRSEDTINFDYSGATPGKALSAVVLDNSGAVKYYG